MTYPAGKASIESSVISKGLCTSCGTCAAFCNVIKIKDETAYPTKKCPEDCRMCYSFCPRTSFPLYEIEMKIFGKTRTDPLLGNVKEAFSARSKDSRIQALAQDGGVVTSLLKYALEKKIIDGAVVAGIAPAVAWMPEPVVITNYDELLKTCGTKYTACPNILGVSTAVRKRKLTKVAFVGTPCQIQAVRKVQFDQTYDVEIDKIKFLIGLFCMESFTYKGLIGEFAEEKLSLAPEIIRKIDIKKGKLQIHTKGEKTISTPLEQLLNYVRESCHFCLDFTSELADVSVGAVGSKLGYSTVLTRTEIGEKIFNEAVEAGFIETKNAENEKPNLDLVRRLTEKKQKENLQKILEKSELTKLSYLSVPKDRLQNYFSSEIRYALEK